MKVVLCELLVIFVLAALQAAANPPPEDMSLSEEQQQLVGRRYAESTIASDISKIMNSMLQKNFVDFLLRQKDKRLKSEAVEEDPYERCYNELLKLKLQEKYRRKI